ncbi:TPA: hypothetical protein ACXE76_004933, partial [Enterobacter chengduensis]
MLEGFCIGCRVAGRYGLKKSHISKIGVGFAPIASIITAVTAQAGFCKYPVALPFFLPAFFFGLLFCCQLCGVFFPGNIYGISSTPKPLPCRGNNPIRTRR